MFLQSVQYFRIIFKVAQSKWLIANNNNIIIIIIINWYIQDR